MSTEMLFSHAHGGCNVVGGGVTFIHQVRRVGIVAGLRLFSTPHKLNPSLVPSILLLGDDGVFLPIDTKQ